MEKEREKRMSCEVGEFEGDFFCRFQIYECRKRRGEEGRVICCQGKS